VHAIAVHAIARNRLQFRLAWPRDVKRSLNVADIVLVEPTQQLPTPESFAPVDRPTTHDPPPPAGRAISISLISSSGSGAHLEMLVR
jgi:hypothetical protein